MKSAFICGVEGCGRQRHAGGYCAPHYRRVKSYGDPRAHIPLKVCQDRAKHIGHESPNTIKATRKPTIKELHWAAGFLDGEGFFGGITCGRQTHQITGTQKSIELLLRLQQLFGGSVRMKTPKIRKDRGGDGIVHYWAVYGARARGVMLTLYPLLSTKRQSEIREAIQSGPRSESVWSSRGARP